MLLGRFRSALKSAKTKLSNIPNNAPPRFVCAAFLVESPVTARCRAAALNDGVVNLQPEHSPLAGHFIVRVVTRTRAHVHMCRQSVTSVEVSLGTVDFVASVLNPPFFRSSQAIGQSLIQLLDRWFPYCTTVTYKVMVRLQRVAGHCFVVKPIDCATREVRVLDPHERIEDTCTPRNSDYAGHIRMAHCDVVPISSVKCVWMSTTPEAENILHCSEFRRR